MATVAPNASEARRFDRLLGLSRIHAIDRWIYVFMAAGFIAIILVGFVPDSVEKIDAVKAGLRPRLPPVMHLHAVLMGSYLLLLLTQTSLAATGRMRWHMRLGALSVAIVPALVVVGLILVQVMYREAWDAAHNAAPDMREKFEAVLVRKESILLVQLRMAVLFPLFVTIGLWVRRTDAGLHKRLMILATAVVLPPALNRITWLPGTFPQSFATTELYMLLAIAPMFIWDTVRNGYVHRAYWIFAGFSLPFAIALNLFWKNAAWHALARQWLAP